MKVLITGATGFTGSHVVPLLLKQGIQVRCLIRKSSNTNLLPVSHIELVYGDLDEQTSIEQALRGADILVNIASLGFGHAPNVVNAAIAANIQRAVFVSTTAIFTTLNAPSKSTRLAAEKTIHNSSLAYTILRPTMIYGSSRDRNMCRLIRYLKRWPAIPVFGNGNYLQQPVYVEDVATAIMQSLVTTQTTNKSYNIPGATPLTYNQIIDTVSQLLGRNVRRLHLPVTPVTKGLNFLENLSLPLPIKAEQILRLNEHKTFDFAEAIQDFDYHPRSFTDGIHLELEQMGLV